jgi:hypothetical protein
MFNAEAEKWQKNKAKDPADVVMPALEKRVKTLKDAAAKAKATPPVPANPPAATAPNVTPLDSSAPTPTPTPASNTSTTKATGKAKDVPAIPREKDHPASTVLTYKESASAALTAACDRFLQQYTAQGLTDPMKLTKEMRDTVLKTITFPADFTDGERKYLLSAMIQEQANKLKIP